FLVLIHLFLSVSALRGFGPWLLFRLLIVTAGLGWRVLLFVPFFATFRFNSAFRLASFVGLRIRTCIRAGTLYARTQHGHGPRPFLEDLFDGILPCDLQG